MIVTYNVMERLIKPLKVMHSIRVIYIFVVARFINFLCLFFNKGWYFDLLKKRQSISACLPNKGSMQLKKHLPYFMNANVTRLRNILTSSIKPKVYPWRLVI